MLLRAGLLVLALVVCAWLAAGLRATQLQAEADRRVPAAQVDRDVVREKRDLLDDARRLNPDTAPLIREAQLLLFISRDRQAIRLLQDVLRREPENYEAWRGLSQAALQLNPRLAQQAAREARRLNPLGS